MPDRAGLATVSAYGVACLVHLLMAGLLTGGLLLVVLGLKTVVQPLIGLLMLGFAVPMRPRFGKLDPDLPTLRRMDAPALYALLDDIAATAGVRRLDAVQVSADFAVRVSTYGIRRRRRMELGLPLWLTLAPQQRVAAVAHEFGHFVSRDIRRGALVGIALGSLAGGAKLMEQRPDTSESAVPAPLLLRHADQMAEYLYRFNARGKLANWALGIPGLVVRGAARLLVRLTLPGARRAEFQADAVAARIASTQAAVSALRDRHLADVVNVEVNRMAIAAHTFSRTRAGQSTYPDFWAKVAAHVAALPDSERERLHGVDLSNVTTTDSDPLGSPAKDSGLPSSSLRVARLSLGAAQPAAVTLDAAGADAIEYELRESKSRLARQVVQDCVRT
ncbi:M48 family metallopeptidase [Streptomyces sp. NPDC048639]|uniref:M48 family metallopeptidase n=1 Tax=Streptomyces sp. NPDC048639 TaxID=3365581 RepID=UPI00371165D1